MALAHPNSAAASRPPGWSLLLWVLAAMIHAALAPPCAAQPERVRVTATASRTEVLPGDQLAVAVVFEHDPGWHIHTHRPVIPRSWGEFPAIPTTIEMDAAPGVLAGAPQWPVQSEIRLDLAGTGTPEPYNVYEGTAVAYIPLAVEPGASAGPRTLVVRASFQACNDRTCLPQETAELRVDVTVLPPGGARGAPNQPELFAGLDQSIFATVGRNDASKLVEFNVFGRSFSVSGEGVAFFVPLLLLAALGGFLLNLTPCVLPVIPIKIMSLSAAAGNRRRLLVLGVASSVGTVGFWLGLGLAIATISGFKATNQLFQNPWFGLGLGVFIGLMGLGMMGLFTVRLPQSVYAVESDKSSVPGSIVFGVMTAVLSTPCTAPFMAAATAWAATQPAVITLGVFGAIGIGMAVPYFALAAFPALIERVPRTGPASELVKQVMGILLLAVAAFFAGTGLDPLLRAPVDAPIRGHWWVSAACVSAAMGWMAWRTFAITRSPARRAVFTLVALAMSGAMAAVAIRVTDRGPIAWVGYTPERYEQARAAGKVIVLDFTAEWCLNCKALESGVLHTDAVVALLSRPDVVPMRVDLTGKNRPGQDLLRSMQWSGIPLLAVTGPGLAEPLKYDTYTVDTVAVAVARAGAASPGPAAAPTRGN